MSDFIYSIKEIFDTRSGILSKNGANRYYIAPYQRGYKWKSGSVHDQVPVLILDLYEAYLKSKISKTEQEYYLQYITVKKDDNQQFEIIDGQQRLTTLTLMFNVLEKFYPTILKDLEIHRSLSKPNGEYIVQYSRYENNSENIFDTINILIESDFDDNKLPEQDKFYMVQASKCFKSFFEILTKDEADRLKSFIQFILVNVKLILNKEDDTSAAEEIFANLNDNKVPLTNAYLIKGLLLTKASRFASDDFSNKHFKEIMDQRAIMGRTWDEMNSWFSKPEISLYFFGTKDNGMEKMLDLISFDKTDDDSEIIEKFKQSFESKTAAYVNPYILFNKYQEKILTSKEAVDYLLKIKHIYKRLQSWYYDDETYNLLGYSQIIKKIESNNKNADTYSENLIDLLDKPSNQDVIIELKKFACSKLQTNLSYEQLGYRTPKKLKNTTIFILLAVNIFPQIKIEGNQFKYRFDFYSYQIEDWSLEHIFPQNPNIDKYNVNEDKFWLLDELTKKIVQLRTSEINDSVNQEINKYEKSIEKINSNIEISSSEIEFVFDKISDPDAFGNMALLSGRVNSALTNGFFNTKRNILHRKINRGSFVPKHTIDVFAKMLELKEESKANVNFGNSLTIWTEEDINAHQVWLIDTIKEIINYLAPIIDEDGKI